MTKNENKELRWPELLCEMTLVLGLHLASMWGTDAYSTYLKGTESSCPGTSNNYSHQSLLGWYSTMTDPEPVVHISQ